MTIVANQPDSALELWDELSEEIWQVQHGRGAPRLMSLGEMDIALQRGEIDPSALVCRVGSNDWRSLAAIAGIDLTSPSLLSFSGELPAYPAAPAEEDSDSLLPVASSIDVTDAADVDLQLDFDLAASPVPAILFVPDAFAASPMRYAGGARSTPRRRPSRVAKHALGLAAMVTTFGVVFVSVSAFLANTYGGGKADAAFVLPRVPHLAAAAFEIPEPRLPEPRAAVPSASVSVVVAPVPTPAPAPVPPVVEDKPVASAPVVVAAKPAPKAFVAAPAAKPAPAPAGISASERAWDSRRVVHKH